MGNLPQVEGIPLKLRFREALRDRILNETIKRGEKLPSEDELSTYFGVSRMALRQEINDLIDEGSLYRRHGVGAIVSHHQLERDHSRLTSIFENSKLAGWDESERILKFEVLKAKYQVSKALNLDECDQVICIETLRYIEDLAVTLHEAYIPHKLFSELLKADIDVEAKDLWGFYERCRYKIKYGIQRLEARQAGDKLAELLNLDEVSPILYIERTIFSEDGTPIEFLYCFNRGDMYLLTVRFSR